MSLEQTEGKTVCVLIMFVRNFCMSSKNFYQKCTMALQQLFSQTKMLGKTPVAVQSRCHSSCSFKVN